MNTLRVYIDFKSPAAYLAFKPTLALAERKDLTLDWQPIRTRQQPVPAEAADEDRGTTHRRVRAQARWDTHLFYAQVQGVPMRFPTGAFPDTDLALACLGALSNATQFIATCFEAYWTLGADLNHPETVANILQRCSDVHLDPANLNVEEILHGKSEQAIADQVIEAPGYVIAEQVFIGREHLPWIEELL